MVQIENEARCVVEQEPSVDEPHAARFAAIPGKFHGTHSSAQDGHFERLSTKAFHQSARLML
jgi:hypothetical protein